MKEQQLQSECETPLLAHLQALPGLVKRQLSGRSRSPLRRWQRDLPLRLDVGTAWHQGEGRGPGPNGDRLIALQGSCICSERLLPFGLFGVADGLGLGDRAFDLEASSLAIQALLHFVLLGLAGSRQLSEELLPKLLVEGVRRANQAVYLRSIETCAYMVTALTAALVVELTAYIVNVGNSRAYRYREREGLVQITRDHSLAARMVETGVLTSEEAQHHPERRQLYRGLGSKATVDVDCFKLGLQVDDRLLLCSDGLWEVVQDAQLLEILCRPSLSSAEVCNLLVTTALDNGGLDNISAIVVHVAPITA
ncbi:MAG: serine/threonine-protein phosphatase [Thermogemmatispora sp.]|uniref:PP2C family protein-serine/threonine phosphatase n=1 Tax=Thermogemmatispora sp. TaxID=1968838 RepID=UPI0019EE693A|nr:protein phosphatase 2C domain-containing protein [Thermogemmatispora sp.]MBE3567132.1 serine/threonine-protein phosphatase [Thermogemmatispora sp.]